MMKRIWFIKINGNKEGPFSIQDLRADVRITPDTLVWREGFSKWVPIRKVSELKQVFQDSEPFEPEEEEDESKKSLLSASKGKSELVLDFRRESPPLLFWVLIALIILAYFVYRLSEVS